METKGIKETSEVLMLARDGLKKVRQAKENDGKLSARDALLAWDLIEEAEAAVTGMAEIPAELHDVDKAEAQALAALAVEVAFEAIAMARALAA